ncbi:MAG TPA: Do family serine endopeptidase [Prolixibacteraceae bacterium]|nr:Do family serine endopeptidase [Prolixibacteraceae bacterium]
MKKFQNVLFAVIIAVVAGFSTVYIYTRFFEKPKIVTVTEPRAVQYASLSSANAGPDLTIAAENSVKAVVHIRTEYQQRVSGYSSGNPFFDFFFGDRYHFQEPQIQQASGSGVIISDDGYIVTNNHVIAESDVIKVTLHDNREFEAKLVGTDPSTDIALLKIDEKDLPAILWGNSDELKLGEWVLAVGNPFNLTSTVTAGIVSAKSRGIGIIGDQMPIESFIQTDAAVNPGNSGGALVNTRGELVGINTAIASRTGSYSGYSFAVPVSIVKKVVDDLKQFGEVQRAILGVRIQTVNAELAKEFKLDKVAGVYIAAVEEDGAAKEAGIKEGDVILSVNGVNVNTTAELQEQIGKQRPGDKVDVLVKRDSKEKLFQVTLRNTKGGTGIIKDSMSVMGAELAKADEQTKAKLNIRNGLKIQKLEKGKLKEAGIREGFIIVKVNKTAVNSIEDFKQVLKQSSGGVLLEGIYPNGEEAYYVFGID